MGRQVDAEDRTGSNTSPPLAPLLLPQMGAQSLHGIQREHVCFSYMWGCKGHTTLTAVSGVQAYSCEMIATVMPS